MRKNNVHSFKLMILVVDKSKAGRGGTFNYRNIAQIL